MSGFHYKANGSLDMRFSSSKSYVSSGGSMWGPSSSSYCSPSSNFTSSNDNYHYKKDGTLDMRYKSSKDYVSSTNNGYGLRGNRDDSYSFSPSNDDYHYKKDSTLDMRYKSSKDYVLAGGSIYGPQNEISSNYYSSGISFTSNILGDEIQSVYTFHNPNCNSSSNNIQNTQDLQNSLKPQYPDAPSSLDSNQVIHISGGQRKINLGIRTVYHATTYKAAQSILRDKCLHKGNSGMFGPGIYFASTMQIAKQKSRQVVGAYVQCKVDFGYALILENPQNNYFCEFNIQYFIRTIF